MNAELWSKFLRALRNHTDSSVDGYLELLSCHQMTDKVWELTLPDPGTLNYFETRLLPNIGEALKEIGVDVSVRFSCEDTVKAVSSASAEMLPFGEKSAINRSDLPTEYAAFRTGSTNRLKSVTVVDTPEPSNLNPDFTFDTFVNGKSNEFAYFASKAVADAPGYKYPLLYLYGGVGLGKTHLMHAVGNEVQRKRGLRVRYLTTEQFFNAFVEAIQNDSRAEFRQRMRKNVDVLLLDDIQWFSKHDSTIDEFFNTFNELISARGQIIITSDKRPNEIYGLPERLSSRFNQGLLADILPPDFETRVAILRKKAMRENLYLTEDVAEYIASKVTMNIRELEGYLKSIAAMAECRRERISKALAMEMIEPIVRTQHVQIDINMIISRVCTYYAVSRDDIMGTSRRADICLPRQIIQYLAYKNTGLSYPEIGKVFGRDHTTVMNSIKKITDKRGADMKLDTVIRKLEDDLHHT